MCVGSLLVLSPEFQSDRRVFGAEHAPCSRFARLGLQCLSFPGNRGCLRNPAYFFKGCGRRDLPMVCGLLPAQG